MPALIAHAIQLVIWNNFFCSHSEVNGIVICFKTGPVSHRPPPNPPNLATDLENSLHYMNISTKALYPVSWWNILIDKEGWQFILPGSTNERFTRLRRNTNVLQTSNASPNRTETTYGKHSFWNAWRWLYRFRWSAVCLESKTRSTIVWGLYG